MSKYLGKEITQEQEIALIVEGKGLEIEKSLDDYNTSDDDVDTSWFEGSEYEYGYEPREDDVIAWNEANDYHNEVDYNEEWD